MIRTAFAHEVDAGMRLAGLTLEQGVHAALARLSALAREGAPVLAFTSAAIWRGWVGADGEARIALLSEARSSGRR